MALEPTALSQQAAVADLDLEHLMIEAHAVCLAAGLHCCLQKMNLKCSSESN